MSDKQLTLEQRAEAISEAEIILAGGDGTGHSYGMLFHNAQLILGETLQHDRLALVRMQPRHHRHEQIRASRVVAVLRPEVLAVQVDRSAPEYATLVHRLAALDEPQVRAMKVGVRESDLSNGRVVEG